MRWLADREGVLKIWGAGAVMMMAAASACVAEPLTTAAEVRSLTVEEAEEGLPVEVTGVVIFSDPPTTVFIQDETAGTFFRLGGADPPTPGDVVRVRGETQPGLYLPGIHDSTYEFLRHEGLPEPLPVTWDGLMSGRYHYQRVLIEGIVRTVTAEQEGASVVRVAMGSRVVEVRVEQPLKDDEPVLVGSRVAVAGLAAGHINARRQLVEPYLRCIDWPEFRVLEPAPAPEAVPVLSSEQLLNFESDGQGGHRVQIRGTVLATFPGGELFLRDEDSAIGVKLLQSSPGLQPGDAVEVMGFPEMERFSASLADAVVAAHEPGAERPEPVPATISELMTGAEDGNLVSVVANLTDAYRTAAGGVLVLQEENATIQARLPVVPEGVSAGAQVRVIGICQVETTRGSEYRSTPGSVSLRLRSADDVEVLRAPTWWTTRRLAAVLVVALVAVLLAALWIVLLRRQVASQTVALRRRIEHEAALEERQRIAREFHDTLEQELAGLSLRLDAAVARQPEGKLLGLLEGSRRLVSRVQTETRNLVSDLRDTSGETASLEAALGELAATQAPGVGPELRVQLRGEEPLPPLPTRTVHHLSMIAREAVANALKHAEATRIALVAGVEDGAVALRIADDGRGFDAETQTHGRAGHFGCMGIRERCAKIGAHVTWHSRPGEGSAVEVRLPLQSAENVIEEKA